MPIDHIDTLIIGAGQAGIAMSEHLSGHKIDHLVLEKYRIAEHWRSRRWDSLVANGPAWHDRFPNMTFADTDPHSFVPKEQVADYFAAYAAQIKAPIRCGVEVTKVSRHRGQPGFNVETSDGILTARNVVAATGAFQNPVIPPIVPADAGLVQIHSSDYRNPEQLPTGAVLVIGAGSSGSQIAEELLHAGKSVSLSIGPHDRPPRRYRGRDNVWWLGVLGKWDTASQQPGKERFTICVSGANGGRTVDFRRFAADGMRLVGMADKYASGTLTFAADLAANIAAGDAGYLALLDEADAYLEQNGIFLPEDPEARIFGPDPDCLRNPIRHLDLTAAGITSIIWATGFSADYGWLEVAGFDPDGKPQHHRGISVEPGIFFLGLPWQSRKASSFIWGVWHDAKYLADHIANQRMYRDFYPLPENL